MKTGPKLNLIKKIWGKRGWGGRVTLQLCELSSKRYLTKKLNLIKKNLGEGGGGEGGGH